MIRKFAASGLLIFLLTNANGAQAITWELSGKIFVSQSPETPEVLNSLEGTPYSAYLTYNEEASPTSIWSPSFANYANEGHFAFSTVLGSASGDLENLQTFIFNGVPAQGSNFNGASFNLTLDGSLSSLALVPTSFDFQFAQDPWGDRVGLSSFALPAEINLANFNGLNFVRLNLSSAPGLDTHTSITGVIDTISPVPEPHAYLMLLSGLLLVTSLIRTQNRWNLCAL